MADAYANRFLRYFPLLLDALRSTDPAPMRPAEARSWIQGNAAVPSEELTRSIVGGGQTIFENDVHWARFYLAKAGLISSAKRGFWSLTPAGQGMHLTPQSTKEIYERVRDVLRPGAVGEEGGAAPEVDEEEGRSYWFAGAVWEGIDKSESFREGGLWMNGNDNQDRLVARMKVGDRIAIKSTFVRKHGLPFDAHGKKVSCMRIKATGTITGNKGDGRTVTVDWDPPVSSRDWYFYTYRIALVEADAESEMARKLIAFTFEGAAQEFDWWLKQPYWTQRYGRSETTALPVPPIAEDTGGVEAEEEFREAPTYTLQDVVSDGCFVPMAELEMMLGRWRQRKNMILQGPPGTGKTFLARRLAYALIGSKDPETVRSRLRVVQFHPSLAYEDFVRGWRPKGKEGLDLVDGIFMQAIDAARSEPDREYVLVIEEINRGNPAQIFGELLTLMEAGKRRRDDAMELAYRRTDDERVFVPDNLYVIGTMNVADRSLALVDLALRRRFVFSELEPRLGPEWTEWCRKRGIGDDVTSLIAARVAALNKQIADASRLGPQFRIGHSFVTPEQEDRVADGRAWFRGRVEAEIGPSQPSLSSPSCPQ